MAKRSRIFDHRSKKDGVPIKDMPNGTWFTAGLYLFLKVNHEICVDGQSRERVAFNEECLGQPVEVELHVMKNI